MCPVQAETGELEGGVADGRPDRPTLLYDDGCRFCRAMAEVLFRLSRTKELAFLPWSSEVAEGWLAELEPAVRDRSMHLKLQDGTLLSGNGVLGATLGSVRGLKWVPWLAAHVPGAARVLAASYGFVAGHREFFSRCVPNRAAVIRQPRIR